MESHRGLGSLRAEFVRGESTVTRARATYPLKFLTPRFRGQSAWTYVSSMGGGLVDGDRLGVSVRVSEHATSFLGTQASTKVFRSPTGKGCRQELQASVEEDATLVLLPDPVTCFANARYEQVQSFDLHEDGNLLLLDWITSGRWSTGERWAFSRYSSRCDVFVGGDHRLADTLVLDPADGDLAGRFRMGEFNCLAVVVIIGPRLQSLVDSSRCEIEKQNVGKDMGVIESFSPIEGGAVLRLVGLTTELVGFTLRRRLANVAQILGESPWERKW